MSRKVGELGELAFVIAQKPAPARFGPTELRVERRVINTAEVAGIEDETLDRTHEPAQKAKVHLRHKASDRTRPVALRLGMGERRTVRVTAFHRLIGGESEVDAPVDQFRRSAFCREVGGAEN